MSRAHGSSTAWRKLRAYIAERDSMRCQRPGCECGGAALVWARGLPNSLTCGHIVALVDGGTDHPDNLRAECARGNYADGARMRNASSPRAAINTSRAW